MTGKVIILYMKERVYSITFKSMGAVGMACEGGSKGRVADVF